MAPKMLDRNTEPEEAVEVTWEDQARINTFSKLNTRMADLADELKRVLEEKEALEDLSMELELADEDEPVLYKMGDSFVHLSLACAQKTLEKDSKEIDGRAEGLRKRQGECEDGMRELKVNLYAKFGSQINLETNPEE